MSLNLPSKPKSLTNRTAVSANLFLPASVLAG